MTDNIYNLLYLVVHEYRSSLKQGHTNYLVLADEAFCQVLSHLVTLSGKP